MDTRPLQVALTAGAAGVLAVAGFGVDAWLDAFEPCRVAYRLSDGVRGSLACQTYYFIAQLSALLAFAACGLGAIAGILLVVRRRRPG